MRSIRMIKMRGKGVWLAAAAAAALTALTLSLTAPLMAQPAPPDLASKQAEVDRLKGELASINSAAEQAVERYNQASSELEGTRRQMADNEKALGEATTKLAAAKARLAKRIDGMYRDGELGFLDVMLSTSSFGEFMTRFDMLSKISQQDRSDVEDVVKYRADVENTLAALELNRQRQEELLAAVTEEKSAVESQLSARQAVLAGAEGEVARMLAVQLQQEQAAAAAAPGSAPAGADAGQPAPGQPPAEDPGAGEPPAEPSPEPPPPTSGGAVSIAYQYIGVPYVWGGASPSGFDCSGLVMYVYAQLGIYLPHSAAAQYYSGTPVSYGDLAPGDLVFFGSPISHVGIYIGGGSMIHAPFEGATVSVTSVGYGGSYAGAARL